MTWLCSCGVINGGTNKHCSALLTWHDKPHNQISENKPDWIMAVLVAKELNMTKDEELFASFYNHEKILVKDMDHIALKEHREELQKIAFEAKARLVAADDEARERKAKTANKQWLVTETKPDLNVSDAINAVRQRAVRMTKMDKLRKQLEDAGIDDSTINEMVRNLENKATTEKLKTVTFTKPSTEVSAVQVKPVANGTVKVPFNPSSLKFGGKS